MSTNTRTADMRRDALAYALQMNQRLEADTAKRKAVEIIADLEEIGFRLTRTSAGDQLSWTSWIQDWQKQYDRAHR